MSEHANVMSETTSILFGGFLGNATHPSKFWQAPIELWCGKTMYRHHANFHLALLHLGQKRSVSQAKSKHLASNRLIFGKNGPD